MPKAVMKLPRHDRNEDSSVQIGKINSKLNLIAKVEAKSDVRRHLGPQPEYQPVKVKRPNILSITGTIAPPWDKRAKMPAIPS